MKTRFVAASLISLSCLAMNAQAATPSHQYRLDGSLADDMAGPALVASGGSLDASGYSFGANQGLTMQVPLGSTYTIDLLFHFDNVNAGWNKIIDFKSLTSDSGMYTLNGSWDYCCSVGNTFGTVTAGVDARLTLTRSAAGNVDIYVNGALQASRADGGIGDLSGDNASFFIDDTVTHQNEARAGRVDYIRTFATALSANEVAALGSTPSAVPEPASAALMMLGLAGVAAAAARRRRS